MSKQSGGLPYPEDLSDKELKGIKSLSEKSIHKKNKIY
jgi:hypothetical protein